MTRDLTADDGQCVRVRGPLPCTCSLAKLAQHSQHAYGALCAFVARQNSVQKGARGMEWCGMFFDRGLLGSTCIVSDRVFACWLAVARVLFRVVDMARCEPSQQAKTASKTVHVAPNGIVFVLCVTQYLSTSLYLSLPPSHLPLSTMHMLLHVRLHLLSPLLCASLLAGPFSKT